VNAYEVKTQAWQKVMAACRWRDDLKSDLWADYLYIGINSGPMLGNEYGRTLLLPIIEGASEMLITAVCLRFVL